MNEYQKVLQVLEKEYQVTCDVAGIAVQQQMNELGWI